MSLIICVLTLLVCFGKASFKTWSQSECGSDTIPWCQASVNNNCLCVKQFSDDIYAVCTCTYSYSLDNVAETGIKSCCLMQVSIGENCNDDSQCNLKDKDMVCTAGYCQCNDGFAYNNETGICTEISSSDFHGATATVAVGTTCIVLVLIIVLLILLFMHRKAKTERQISYLRNRINTNVPYSENVQHEDVLKDIAPPSYNEIERGETPPPPFESLDCIFEDSEVHGSD